MNDIFKEQLVKRKPDKNDTLKKIGIVIGAVLILAIITMIPFLLLMMPVVAVVLVLMVKFLFTFFNVEYEYIFTNGELDIDLIYNQSRRKKAFSIHVRDIEIMAKINDKAYENEFNKKAIIKDFSSRAAGSNTFAFLVTKDGQKFKIIFEPNEILLDAISKYVSTRVLHK